MAPRRLTTDGEQSLNWTLPDDVVALESDELLVRQSQEPAKDGTIVLSEGGGRSAMEAPRAVLEPHRISLLGQRSHDRVVNGLEEPAGAQGEELVDLVWHLYFLGRYAGVVQDF